MMRMARRSARHMDEGVLLIAIILVGAFAMIGWATPIQTQNKCDGSLLIYGRCETGTGTWNVLSTTGTAITTITFPTAFTNTPVVSVIPTSAFPFGAIQTQTLQTFYFLSDGVPSVWTPFPTAQTELFNDAQGEHRITVYDTLNWGQLFLFCVNLNQVAATAGASIRIMYSIDFAVTWNSFDATSDLLVDGSVGFYTCKGGTVPSNSRISQGQVQFRVDGYGGDNLLDVVSFTEIYFEVVVPPLNNNVCSWRLNTVATTLFQVSIQCALKPASTTAVTFRWKAESENG